MATSREFIAGDPLRAVAALGVLVSHCAFIALLISGAATGAESVSVLAGRVSYTYVTSALTPVALLIFFVLSGYLIARPFVEALMGARAFPAIPRYLRNRVLRIVPAMWAVVTLVLLVLGARGSSPGQIGAVYAGLQIYHPSPFSGQIAQLWSVDVELGFYLLLPLAAAALLWVVRVPMAVRAPMLLVVLVAVFLGSLGLHTAVPRGTFWLSPPWTAFLFVPGVALAVVEAACPEWLSRARAGATWSWLPGVLGAGGVGLLGVYLLIQGPRDQPFDYLSGLPGAIACTGCGLAVGALLLRQRLAGSCPPALDNRLMQWLGGRSYSIFLLHGLVVVGIGFVVPGGLGPWQAFAVLTAATLAVAIPLAALSYRFVELPFLRLKTRAGTTTRPSSISPSSS